MPRFTKSKVAGYYLYFDTSCMDEPAHLHTSSSPKLIYAGTAKIWVYIDGSTKIAYKGEVSEKSLSIIQKYIKNHYLEFFALWEKHCTPFEILGYPDETFTLADIQQLQQEQQIQIQKKTKKDK